MAIIVTMVCQRPAMMNDTGESYLCLLVKKGLITVEARSTKIFVSATWEAHRCGIRRSQLFPCSPWPNCSSNNEFTSPTPANLDGCWRCKSENSGNASTSTPGEDCRDSRFTSWTSRLFQFLQWISRNCSFALHYMDFVFRHPIYKVHQWSINSMNCSTDYHPSWQVDGYDCENIRMTMIN